MAGTSIITPAGMTWPLDRVKGWRTLRWKDAGDLLGGFVVEKRRGGRGAVLTHGSGI